MTIRDLDRLTVTKMYADGKDDDYVRSANPHLTFNQIVEIRSAHGYPHTDAMRKAVAVLQRRVDQADALPVSGSTSPRPQPRNTPRVLPDPPAPKATIASPPPSSVEVTITGDTYAQLLARAAKSPKARTRTLAEKIETQLATLRERLDVDEATNREAARKERERKTALAEVAAAEAALKAARDKLRQYKNHPGGNGRATVTRTPSNREPGGAAATSSLDAKRKHQADILARHDVTAADVRAWATDTGVDVPRMGMLPGRVIDAYDQAHTAEPAAS